MVESSYSLDLVVPEGTTQDSRRLELGNINDTLSTPGYLLGTAVGTSPCSAVPYRNDYAEEGRRSLLSLIGSPSIKSFLRCCWFKVLL